MPKSGAHDTPCQLIPSTQRLVAVSAFSELALFCNFNTGHPPPPDHTLFPWRGWLSPDRFSRPGLWDPITEASKLGKEQVLSEACSSVSSLPRPLQGERCSRWGVCPMQGPEKALHFWVGAKVGRWGSKAGSLGVKSSAAHLLGMVATW